MTNRRSLIRNLGLLVAAPAVIRVAKLMPIKPEITTYTFRSVRLGDDRWLMDNHSNFLPVEDELYNIGSAQYNWNECCTDIIVTTLRNSGRETAENIIRNDELIMRLKEHRFYSDLKLKIITPTPL